MNRRNKMSTPIIELYLCLW